MISMPRLGILLRPSLIAFLIEIWHVFKNFWELDTGRSKIQSEIKILTEVSDISCRTIFNISPKSEFEWLPPAF